MSVIYILLTISLIVALGFLCAFFIAVWHGQFDDSYTPSVRILFDDELVTEESDLNKISHTRPRPPLKEVKKPDPILEISSKDTPNILLSLTRQTES